MAVGVVAVADLKLAMPAKLALNPLSPETPKPRYKPLKKPPQIPCKPPKPKPLNLLNPCNNHLLGEAGNLVSKVISRVISTLNGVTPIITLLINDLLSPLALQVSLKP